MNARAGAHTRASAWPEAMTQGRFSYRNVYKRGVMRFSGEETIHEDERLVYSARYVGGPVDQRGE